MSVKPLLALALCLAAWFAAATLASAAGAQEMGAGAEAAQEIVQTTCPVMEGNKIDPNLYTEFRGKRVYFCCKKCKAAFEANPEAYLHRLPQFAADRSREAGPSGFGPGQFVEPLGLTTLSLLVVTFCLGFFMKKKPKLLFKWHRRLAYVTIIAAASHATLVMLAHNL